MLDGHILPLHSDSSKISLLNYTEWQNPLCLCYKAILVLKKMVDSTCTNWQDQLSIQLN